jgi:hypothetical protein
MAWQCMLFHHSCRIHLGRTPIFVVHGDEEALVPGFEAIERKGGRIQRAPNFRDTGFTYACRNTIHTLDLVRSDADYIALCDPDMIFLRQTDFDGLTGQMAADEVSLDRVAYLYLEHSFEQPIRDVCEHAGIDFATVAAEPLSGGVPYVVPNGLRGKLCTDWSTLTDLCWEKIAKVRGPDSSDAWVAVMWGFVLAVRKQGLKARVTEFCINNLDNPELPSDRDSGPAMVHYCYCHESWSKRRYLGTVDDCDPVWASTAPEGTVNGAICRQLASAAKFFGVG